MKSFIKKYPKRIFISALIVLLIAIVGTVNNYPTYSGSGNKPREISRRTVKYLESIYGEGNIYRAADVPSWYADFPPISGLYYKAADDKYIYLVGRGGGSWPLKTDKEKYARDDSIVVTITYPYSDIEFDSKVYTLEKQIDGMWCCIHPDVLMEAGEVVSLSKGDSWEFSLRLDEAVRVCEEPIRLKRGRYRLSKSITSKRKIGRRNGKWIHELEPNVFNCEFEIK